VCGRARPAVSANRARASRCTSSSHCCAGAQIQYRPSIPSAKRCGANTPGSGVPALPALPLRQGFSVKQAVHTKRQRQRLRAAAPRKPRKRWTTKWRSWRILARRWIAHYSQMHGRKMFMRPPVEVPGGRTCRNTRYGQSAWWCRRRYRAVQLPASDRDGSNSGSAHLHMSKVNSQRSISPLFPETASRNSAICLRMPRWWFGWDAPRRKAVWGRSG